jgi:hypothetical protein
MGVLVLIALTAVACLVAVCRVHGLRVDREAEQAWLIHDAPFWDQLRATP